MPYHLLEKMALLGFIREKKLNGGDVITGHVGRSPVEIHVNVDNEVSVNDEPRLGVEGSVVFDRRLSPFPSRRIVYFAGEEQRCFGNGLDSGSIHGVQLTLGRAWEKAKKQFDARTGK